MKKQSKKNESGVAGKIEGGVEVKTITGLDGKTRTVSYDNDAPISTPDVETKTERLSKKKSKSLVAVADADDLALDAASQPKTKRTSKAKTEADAPVASGVIWEIEDKYSKATATRIVDHFTGLPTEFAMVYGWDGATSAWQSVRPVSDRYKPIRTEDLIDIAMERMEGQPMLEEKVRVDRFGTSLEVKLPINKPIEVGKGKPFDQGHPWTRHGSNVSADVLYPVINIRNAYDATSSIVVDVGLFRLICSNGAKVMLAGMGSRAIHTKHEVARVIEEISQQDFTGNSEFINKLTKTKLTTKDVARIMGSRVPEKWQKELVAYAAMGDNSAWAWMNGLSYLATHEYSLVRSRQLDPVVRDLQKLAA